MNDFSVNMRVKKKIDYLIENAQPLGCRYFRLSNGAHIIDMGINVDGSWEAAKIFTEVNMACLGKCSYRDFPLTPSISMPAVEVYVDNTELGCLASQIAGWKLSEGEYAAIGSGPARAIARVPSDHRFEHTDYMDHADIAVLGLQTTMYPDETMAEEVAQASHVDVGKVYLLVHSNNCLVASVQVSARIVEQTMNKMIRTGFDLKQLVFARGLCIIAPPVSSGSKKQTGDTGSFKSQSDYGGKDYGGGHHGESTQVRANKPDGTSEDVEEIAMGKINDCLLYGGKSDFWVRSTDEEIRKIIPLLVTHSAKDYGKLFLDIFREAGKDFYKIDEDVHSPAQVQIYNMNSGNIFTAGEIRTDIMLKSLFPLL